MKIEGIILAAGLSQRAGTNKLILKIDGITILERCILSMYDHCSRIVIVGGHRIEDIYGITKKYPNIDLIYHRDYLSGMFSSVKAGLQLLEGDRFFLIPGDYPMINKSTYQRMLTIDEDIVIPTYNKKRGHPVLIKTHLVDRILDDLSIHSLKDFIEKNGSTTVDVVDPGILFDVDTIEDFKRINIVTNN